MQEQLSDDIQGAADFVHPLTVIVQRRDRLFVSRLSRRLSFLVLLLLFYGLRDFTALVFRRRSRLAIPRLVLPFRVKW